DSEKVPEPTLAMAADTFFDLTSAEDIRSEPDVAIATVSSTIGPRRISKFDAFNPGNIGHGLARKLPIPESVSYTPLNPISFLDWAARVYPNKIAIKYGDWEIKYKEFHFRVRLFGSALLKVGLAQGDKVAVLCPNTIPALDAHFAVPLAGGVLVTLNTRLALPEVIFILENSESTFLIVDHELTFQGELQKEWARLGRDPGKLVVTDDSGWSRTDGFEKFLDSVSEEVDGEVRAWEEFEPLKDEMATISINYTSGTTGKQKGVQYTYRGCYLTALNVVIGTRLGFDSRFMFVVPMFHCNGWMFPWALTAVAGTFYPVRKIDYDHMWELLTKEKVTHYVGAPTVQAFLVNNSHAQTVSHGVTALTGGSAPAPTLLGRMRELGIWPIIHVYGMTETSGPIVNCPIQPEWLHLSIDDLALKMARPGHVCVTVDDFKVVDEDMVETPWDGRTMGEVVWRGNAIMTGYYKDEEATKRAFEGGWLHSGDIAVRHPDGYIEVRDRKKDVVISGGENISSIEVEQAIARHPKVLEVAVVATPDDTWGERPKAFVVLKKEVVEHGGYEPGEIESDILRHCRVFLGGYKCPARVQLEMELPKTGSGKRHQLDGGISTEALHSRRNMDLSQYAVVQANLKLQLTVSNLNTDAEMESAMTATFSTIEDPRVQGAISLAPFTLTVIGDVLVLCLYGIAYSASVFFALAGFAGDYSSSSTIITILYRSLVLNRKRPPGRIGDIIAFTFPLAWFFATGFSTLNGAGFNRSTRSCWLIQNGGFASVVLIVSVGFVIVYDTIVITLVASHFARNRAAVDLDSQAFRVVTGSTVLASNRKYTEDLDMMTKRLVLYPIVIIMSGGVGVIVHAVANFTQLRGLYLLGGNICVLVSSVAEIMTLSAGWLSALTFIVFDTSSQKVARALLEHRSIAKNDTKNDMEKPLPALPGFQSYLSDLTPVNQGEPAVRNEFVRNLLEMMSEGYRSR
ncbi:hypothetical protein HDU93_006239, partial [Gonapodya sp. JEL0774]